MADFESLEKQIVEGFKTASLRSDGLEKQIDTLAQIMVREFKDVHEEINELKTDVGVLKTDMEIVKEKVSGVHRRIDEEVDQRHELATHVSKLEEKIA